MRIRIYAKGVPIGTRGIILYPVGHLSLLSPECTEICEISKCQNRASINAFLICLLPSTDDVRHPSAQVHGAKVILFFELSKKKRILLRFFLGYFLHISKLNSTFEHLPAAHSHCSIQLKIIRQTYAHDPIN